MSDALESLAHPVNFVVINRPVWPELSDGKFCTLDAETLSRYCVSGVDTWIIRTYYELRVADQPVSLSTSPVRDRINVAPVRPSPLKHRDFRDFLVVPRGDQHRPMFANFYLEQNNLAAPHYRSEYVPYWPQPGIIERASRADRKNFLVSFKGRLSNLSKEFRSDDFIAKLALMGVRVDFGSMNSLHGDHSWNDYRAVDIVLAVRDATLHDLRHKPASKLINAWFAEVPAVLGPEPAYRILRRSELDYVEVSTPEQAISAICRLRDDPNLYERIVSNGRQRRVEFTVDSVRQRWVELLNGPIARAFHEWQERSDAYKKILAYGQPFLESISKRYFEFRRRHGRNVRRMQTSIS